MFVYLLTSSGMLVGLLSGVVAFKVLGFGVIWIFEV